MEDIDRKIIIINDLYVTAVIFSSIRVTFRPIEVKDTPGKYRKKYIYYIIVSNVKICCVA